MRLLTGLLERFVRKGTLLIYDADGNRHEFGDGGAPRVGVKLTDRRLYWQLALRTELRAGEAYMDGTLQIVEGTIHTLLTLYGINRDHLRAQPVQRWAQQIRRRVRRLQQRNSLHRARANVSHHYDLSNELYRLFLDRDMTYSCAYFRTPDDDLETAQRNKLRHIAAKLALQPGQRVLDIGCGWGGMAMYLARHCAVDVVGVTLSEDQMSLARQRVAEQGLQDRVRIELMDYRRVDGPFDRIVSVGMFEHVGAQYYPSFFAKVKALLSDDGVALLHTIGRMSPPGATNPWLSKYIFPGGYSPALSETMAAIEQAGLITNDIEVLRLHYAHTIRAWRERFETNRRQIAEMLDERFCRMWEFYLAAVEIGFVYNRHVVFQIQLSRSLATLPTTRDYMAATEAELLTRDHAQPASPIPELV